MMKAFAKVAAGLFVLICIYLSGCSFTKKNDAASVAGRSPSSSMSQAWEVENLELDSVVPDVFYADAIQNEQIMPTSVNLDGAAGEKVSYQIDSLIYPTIGNPNLFIKNKADEELTVVLRAPLAWSEALKQSLLRVYLVPRNNRAAAESMMSVSANASAFLIVPKRIEQLGQEGVPAELRNRQTLILRFDQQSLANILESGSINGLYDIRIEVGDPRQLLHREFQYNAVRIFKNAPKDDEYRILNVTDSQNSMNQIKSDIFETLKSQVSFKELTIDVFSKFIKFVNESQDPSITQVAFITFNGDLHNGGSPLTVSVEEVSKTYNLEAKTILENLRNLKYPIFLTPGNHDGYVSFGHVPKLFNRNGEMNTLLNSLKLDVNKKNEFLNYVTKTELTPGGTHVDIFQGQYVRYSNQQSMKSWEKINAKVRNHVLYDGFYQWRKIYGPLYMSWSFGKNHYVSVNSYDLRQHSRSGWGMYTVNYGGNMSGFQMDWFRKELAKADGIARDTIVLAHHDPRGGHQGKDYPYYFKIISYNGMGDSALNYVKGEAINPKMCSTVPDWSKSKRVKLDCLHDGLQEWMRADEEFDCVESDLKSADTNGIRICDTDKFSSATNPNGDERRHHWYSGYNFIHQLATRYRTRTLLLGHTHYNNIEVKLAGTDLVPEKVILDSETLARLSDVDTASPIRALGLFNFGKNAKAEEKSKANLKTLKKDGIEQDANGFLEFHMKAGGHSFKRELDNHELAILRLTSVSKLTTQIDLFDNKLAYGFSSFAIKRKKANYELPQINQITFFKLDGNTYKKISQAVELDRTQELNAKNNPLMQIFK